MSDWKAATMPEVPVEAAEYSKAVALETYLANVRQLDGVGRVKYMLDHPYRLSGGCMVRRSGILNSEWRCARLH